MATFKARGKVSTDRIDMSRLRPTIRSNRVQASIFFRRNVFSVGHARGILSSISSIYMYIYIHETDRFLLSLARNSSDDRYLSSPLYGRIKAEHRFSI